MPLPAQRIGGRRISFASDNELPVERLNLLAAGLDRRELLSHPRAELRELVGFHAVLAREAPDIEQPRLDAFETVRIEDHRIGGAGDPVLGLARLDQRAVQRR